MSMKIMLRSELKRNWKGGLMAQTKLGLDHVVLILLTEKSEQRI